MKVVYVGIDAKKRRTLREQEDDVIILSTNRWDDFTYKTTFSAECRVKREKVDIGTVQILVDGKKDTHAYLDKLVDKGWDGVFPIPSSHYISVPASLSFYQQIIGNLNLEEAQSVATLLRDASYMTKILDDEAALRLLSAEGFRKSLQREQGAIKAYMDGGRVWNGSGISSEDQNVRFRNADGVITELTFRFKSNNPLPHDINVLIGPNGIGKSYLLHQIINRWLSLDPDVSIGLTHPKNDQIVVVSYSPFESFPVDSKGGEERKDNEVYRYFGLRGRRKELTESKRGSDAVTLSVDFPQVNAARSLIKCVKDDQRYGAIREWSNKVATMQQVLRRAIDFDFAAINIRSDADTTELCENPHLSARSFIDLDADDDPDGRRLVPIDPSRTSHLKPDVLARLAIDRLGVSLLKDGKVLHLSSGQRLFSYLVINILGAIRRNSLIIIDEPELFLHASLEVAFVNMLKSILKIYDAKALIATHSLVLVREVPRDCVHVFERTRDGVIIGSPPFETFGGDIQRIASYVFKDKLLDKPYEEWVKAQLDKFGSAEELLSALGSNVNEELVLQIYSMGRGAW